MNDSSEQSDARIAHAEQSSELGERLLRRLTEPAGVIDVHYAQRKYARLAEWLDKLYALLNQLQIRYAVGEDLEDGGQPLLMHEPLGEQINLYSTAAEPPVMPSANLSPSAQSFSSDASAPAETLSSATRAQLSTTETSATQSSAPVSSSSLPEGKFRVSHRPVPLDSNLVTLISQSAQLPPTRAHSREAATEPGYYQSSAMREVKASKEDVSVAASSAVTRVTTEEIIQAAPIVQAVPAASVLHPALPLVTPQAAPERDDQPMASQFIERTVVVTRKRDASAVTNKQDVVTKVGEHGAGDHKYAASEREAMVVATEEKDDSFAQVRPEMVWRQNLDATQTSDAISGEPGGNPQARSAHQVDQTTRRSQQSDQASAPVSAKNNGEEISIEQVSPQLLRTISEKVMRDISLDLAIELERRGLKKWR